MSHTCPRRTVAALLVALSAFVALPAAALAKKQDLKVMSRNVYLGADLIPLAAAPDQAAFEQAAAQRFQTVQTNDFPARAKALAAEIKKNKPDVIGVQEATIWRRGADGVKDGATTPATQVIYDSSKELQKALKAAGSPYKEVVGPRLVRLRGADRAQLRHPHHAARHHPRPQGLQGEGPQDVPWRVHEPLRSADAGWRGAAAARLGRRRRHAGQEAGSAS